MAVPDITAETTAKTLIDTIIVRYGCPHKILSNHGAGYESALFKELCRLLGIFKLRTSPYNPKSNPVERWHRFMHTMLAKCVKTNQKDWDDVIGLVAAVCRAIHMKRQNIHQMKSCLGKKIEW